MFQNDSAADAECHDVRPGAVSIEDVKSGVGRGRRLCNSEGWREQHPGIGKQISLFQGGDRAPAMALVVRRLERAREAQDER